MTILHPSAAVVHGKTSRLVVITPPSASIPDEPRWLNQMLDAGLEAAHVRKPGWSEEQLRAYVSQISLQHRPKLRIHSHHHLANEMGIGGIHYPAAVLPKLPLQPALTAEGRQLLQSTSFHMLSDLQGKGHYGALDYAFLSPVFDSISKQGYTAAAFDRGQLRARLAALAAPPDPAAAPCCTPATSPPTAQQQRLQTDQCQSSSSCSSSASDRRQHVAGARSGPAVIALGGISAANIREALRLGFDGAAVLGAVWVLGGGVTPVTQLQQLLKAMNCSKV
uniref:Thiamine phosphate synthase/TenI domain-containing protein n=1 Tax=Chlamydomonas leiostraca TaxID=1034604 RepID=A0A7S0X0U7_9CHLO|mmetsp:Transcript_6488/g.16109  ORF Transcript_6488/g.16109 Transcript_6488/m.16109 type:complete len:279 (+) Transcript_6488:140-976(+)